MVELVDIQPLTDTSILQASQSWSLVTKILDVAPFFYSVSEALCFEIMFFCAFESVELIREMVVTIVVKLYFVIYVIEMQRTCLLSCP